MFLFFQSRDSFYAVPVSRVYSVRQYLATIIIDFEDGSYATNSDGTSGTPIVKSVRVGYDDEETALGKMREFFSAMAKQKTNAFYF